MTTIFTAGSVCYALTMTGFICFKQPILKTIPPTPNTIECASPNVAQELGVKICEWVLK